MFKKILTGMKWSLMIIGALTIFSTLVMTISVIVALNKKEPMPEKIILEIDLNQEIKEYVPDDPAAQIMADKKLTLIEILEALEKGGDDDRVVGLVTRLGSVGMGFGKIQEIRDAILRFRESGKPTMAYADTFGEFGPGNGAYYLASAFEEIHLQPSGDLNLTGFMFEVSFVKDTLDKLGLTARMDSRKEYKNALNIFTETEFTPAHEEALGTVMDSLYGQMVSQIAEARGLTPDEMEALFDQGVFLGQETLDAGLVDSLSYQDQVFEKIRERMGADAEKLSLAKYRKRAGGLYDEGETIAIIYGIGGVQRGKEEYNPLSGEYLMSSQRVSRAFRKALEDDSVKAILFRVDSPGGSYVASDTIWRETMRAKEKGIPVIVSMGDVAGSGGYFVAMAAEKIVAHPATITGSIGVFAGKFLTADFWEMLGVSWDEIHTNPNATMWTGTQDYTPQQWELIQKMLDRIYADFTQKAAEGRDLSMEEMERVARGRIWTGEHARGLGLVDELGGYPAAIALAKESAGISPEAKIRLKRFPEKRPLIEAVMEKLTGTGESVAVVTAAAKALQPLVREVHRIGIGEKKGVLTAPIPEMEE